MKRRIRPGVCGQSQLQRPGILAPRHRPALSAWFAEQGVPPLRKSFAPVKGDVTCERACKRS